MEDGLNGAPGSLFTPFIKNANVEIKNHIDLEWNHLSVEVKEIFKKQERKKMILKDCTGYINHGRMLSIMGPSGI